MCHRGRLTDLVVLAVPDEGGRLPHLKGGLSKRLPHQTHKQNRSIVGSRAVSYGVWYLVLRSTWYLTVLFVRKLVPSADVGSSIPTQYLQCNAMFMPMLANG